MTKTNRRCCEWLVTVGRIVRPCEVGAKRGASRTERRPQDQGKPGHFGADGAQERKVGKRRTLAVSRIRRHRAAATDEKASEPPGGGSEGKRAFGSWTGSPRPTEPVAGASAGCTSPAASAHGRHASASRSPRNDNVGESGVGSDAGPVCVGHPTCLCRRTGRSGDPHPSDSRHAFGAVRAPLPGNSRPDDGKLRPNGGMLGLSHLRWGISGPRWMGFVSPDA